MNKDIQQLASQLYTPLFADRDSIQVAYDLSISEADNCDSPAAMVTAIHVLMNSIAIEIEKRNDTRRVVSSGERTADAEATEEETARCPGL